MGVYIYIYFGGIGGMVNNKSKILDENIIKNVCEIIEMKYSKKSEEKYREVIRACHELDKIERKIDKLQEEINQQLPIIGKYETLRAESDPNDPYTQPTLKQSIESDRAGRIIDNNTNEITDLLEEQFLWQEHLGGIDYNEFLTCSKDFQMKTIENHFHIPPMTPNIMINISPDWKGQTITKSMIDAFCECIESYAKEMNNQRYNKLTYILESGKEGNHLHAHCVFSINPEQINSVLNGKNSHIKKGKHIRQINTWWKKGVFGGIKLNIQSVILRTELLIEDKIKYLDPDNKPLGHENLTKLMEIKEIDFS